MPANTSANAEAAYVPEIDGLRALAVVAVIVNHVNRQALPSGYLGVDVFFVISGFVITASLAGRPSKHLGDLLLGFYARRIRRLVPALVVCALVAVVLARLIIPDPAVSLATGRRAVFGFSNLFLYDQATDYFGGSIRLNVFMHTWSLGVEEQFYLVFPFLLWFAGLGRGPRGARVLAWVMGALAVGSLAVWLYGNAAAPSAAYYLMPARLWELGLGCIVCLIIDRNGAARWFARTPPLPVCVALIGVLFLPRGYIVGATIAAVGLTAVLVGTLRVRPEPAGVLRHPAVVYVGRLSYSLYLWHWIVICFGRWTVGIHARTIPFLLAAMVVLAVVTFHAIEMPFRRVAASRRRWVVIASGLAACAAVAGLSKILEKRPDLAPEGIRAALTIPPAYVTVVGSNVPYDPTCVVDADRPLHDTTLELCTAAPTRAGAPTIWTLGDSHAGHLQGMLYAVRERAGVGVHLVETPGVAFPMTKDNWFEPRDSLFQQITKRLRPGDVVLIARLYVERGPSHQPIADLAAWYDEVERLASTLAEKRVTLVVAGPPPVFQFEDIGLCRSGYLGGDSCDISRASIATQLGTVYRSLAGLADRHTNLVVFDELAVLCPGDTCTPVVDRVARYRDRDHLNVVGAAELAGPFVELLRRRGLLPRG